VALFRRGHRRLELTDDGRHLASAVAAAIAGIVEAVEALRAPRRRQVLAVTTTPGLASLWLIPRLSDFVATHPGIDVRIDATLTARAMAADGFDLAIRYLTVDNTAGQPLFPESVLPLCAPALLARGRPPLKTAADLHAHTLLQMEVAPGTGMPLEWESWLSAHGLPELQPRSVVTFSSYNEVIAAVLEGQGVALGRRPLIDGLLRQRKLVAPFGDIKQTAKAYFVVTDAASRARPAVRAMEEWLHIQARRTTTPEAA